MVVLPGQTANLSVSTDATGVTYQWFRDGNPISGATNASLTVSDTETGDYFARVSLTGGTCSNTSVDSEITTVVAPVSLEMDIAYNGAYSPCDNISAVLEVSRILALDSGGGETDVTSDIIGSMSFQWFLNGNPVNGATSSSISLTDVAENGDYHVEATISSYSPASNTLPVQLRINETLAISSSDQTVCGPAEPVTLSTSRDLTGETYDWFRDGVALNQSTPSIEVSSPGTYQLVLQTNGCPLPSNEVTLNTLDESIIALDPGEDIRIPEGTSRVVTATGGDTYRWFNSENTEISTASTVSLTEEGTYLLLATVGGCEVSRALTVTYLDTFKVPNVISVNGDGINDQWVIPNSYSGKPDVIVTIYNDKGEEVLNVNNYQNNWPSSSAGFSRQNMVFYYKIRNAEKTLKQGTITVIR
jgi:gliding motility-associated-like protein